MMGDMMQLTIWLTKTYWGLIKPFSYFKLCMLNILLYFINFFCSPIDAFNPDYKQYPKFRRAQAISFTQQAGDLLIIPTGWFHQVNKTITRHNSFYRIKPTNETR